MSGKPTSPLRQRKFFSPTKAQTFKSARTSAIWAWVATWASVLLLALLLILGRISLTLAAGSAIALVGILVLAAVSNRAKLMFIFFLNACLLVVARRVVGGVDIAVLVTLLTTLLIAFSFASSKTTAHIPMGLGSGKKNFNPVEYLLIGFAVLSILSTWSNSQSLFGVLHWLSGITIALLIGRMPLSQLPSFSNARRAILVGGGIAGAYDLYLLVTGKALNVGSFNVGRFLGSLGDYELLAEFYGAIILLALTALFFDQSRSWRVASGAIIVPGFLIILATQSRGPIVILCAVVPILILISAFQFRESIGRIFAVFIGMALGVSVFMGALSATPFFERFSSIQFGGDVETIINRSGVWDYFTQLPGFIDVSFIGNGFEYPYEEIGTYPHSLYLWLIWSGGPALLTCFALLVLVLLGKLFRGIALRHSSSLSIAVVIVFILLDEVKIEAARTVPTVLFLWVFVSLAVLANREQREL